jgi:hypothetical protein
MHLVFFLLTLTTGLPLLGWGTAESGAQVPYKQGQKITVTGIIKLVGNEPFSEMVIKSHETGRIFYLPPAFKKDNRRHIASQVTIEGTVSIEVIESADHKYRITKVFLMQPVVKK